MQTANASNYGNQTDYQGRMVSLFSANQTVALELEILVLFHCRFRLPSIWLFRQPTICPFPPTLFDSWPELASIGYFCYAKNNALLRRNATSQGLCYFFRPRKKKALSWPDGLDEEPPALRCECRCVMMEKEEKEPRFGKEICWQVMRWSNKYLTLLLIISFGRTHRAVGVLRHLRDHQNDLTGKVCGVLTTKA